MTGNDELFDEWPEKYDQWFKTPHFYLFLLPTVFYFTLPLIS
jgi:hypothetical protein